MKKLGHLESKLLKKTDLFNYRNEKTSRENIIIQRYKLKDHDEYRKYNKVVGKIQALVAALRKLPAESEVKIRVARELSHKLYRIGLINSTKGSLEDVEKVTVSAFCRRRLTEVLKRLKFAQPGDHAITTIEHGHIRIGADVVTDPAILVTRDMEDAIQWAEGSRLKR